MRTEWRKMDKTIHDKINDDRAKFKQEFDEIKRKINELILIVNELTKK
jgi:hypothetical protein